MIHKCGSYAIALCQDGVVYYWSDPSSRAKPIPIKGAHDVWCLRVCPITETFVVLTNDGLVMAATSPTDELCDITDIIQAVIGDTGSIKDMHVDGGDILVYTDDVICVIRLVRSNSLASAGYVVSHVFTHRFDTGIRLKDAGRSYALVLTDGPNPELWWIGRDKHGCWESAQVSIDPALETIKEIVSCTSHVLLLQCSGCVDIYNSVNGRPQEQTYGLRVPEGTIVTRIVMGRYNTFFFTSIGECWLNSNGTDSGSRNFSSRRHVSKVKGLTGYFAENMFIARCFIVQDAENKLCALSSLSPILPLPFFDDKYVVAIIRIKDTLYFTTDQGLVYCCGDLTPDTVFQSMVAFEDNPVAVNTVIHIKSAGSDSRT